MNHRFFAASLLVAVACSGGNRDERAGATAVSDSSFKAMDHRHGAVVGADPSALAHRFVSLPDGGDIVLDRKAGDTTTVKAIRTHLEGIAQAFSKGDFSTPAFVHEMSADGADVMAKKAGAITYTVVDSPEGAILRIRTTDAEALDAIHAFISFQTREHLGKDKADNMS